MYYCKECNCLYYVQDLPRSYDPVVKKSIQLVKRYTCIVHKETLVKRLVIPRERDRREDVEYLSTLVTKSKIQHINLNLLSADQLLKLRQIYNL